MKILDVNKLELELAEGTKQNGEYIYVGSTRRTLSQRLRGSISLVKKEKVYNYKFSHLEKIQVYTWCFESLSVLELENIEAELVYQIRTQIGSRPKFQNEIHFNNGYNQGKKIASKLMLQLSN